MQVLWVSDDTKSYSKIMRPVIPTTREQCDVNSVLSFLPHRVYEFSGRTICVPHEGRERIQLWEEQDAPADPRKITELESRCDRILAAASEDIRKYQREIAKLHARIRELEGTL